MLFAFFSEVGSSSGAAGGAAFSRACPMVTGDPRRTGEDHSVTEVADNRRIRALEQQVEEGHAILVGAPLPPDTGACMVVKARHENPINLHEAAK